MSDLQELVREKLATIEHLAVGIGTKNAPCSVAAINLALTGQLTDEIPDCMSGVIGRAIIVLQDSMPAELRDSQEWRDVLVRSVGTGRVLEQERLAVLFDWMWGTALPLVQPLADNPGFGGKWQTMCAERTESAAGAARAAADAARAAWAAARTAAEAAEAADAARAAWAAWAAAGAARAAGGDPWPTLDPVSLINRMIDVEVAS